MEPGNHDDDGDEAFADVFCSTARTAHDAVSQ